MTDPLRLGPGGEFDRIRAFLAGLPPAPGVRVGPGDDAAVLVDGTVLSTDMAVEGVHWNPAWTTPREAGWRAGAAALSDLAAMAAEPVGLLVSLAAPREGGAGDQAMAGIREVADAVGAPLLGGDLTRSPGPLVVDVVVVGRTGAPLLRSGARPGDELWVTGTLGGAHAALRAWRDGADPDPRARAAFARPHPRIQEARWLVQTLGARGGLDLSDGLAGDAAHLATASGVAVYLDEDQVRKVAFQGGVEGALHGGEDYELLVALPPGRGRGGVEEFRERFDLVMSPVGRVAAGSGVHLVPSGGGDPEPLRRGGWDHFQPAPDPPRPS
jgi:thiamine-monophosphate kinase